MRPDDGDVARMHRRLGEISMDQTVPQNKLHIIAATSALEAGVNIKGLDMVVVMSSEKCSRSSLLQRIGRAGRKPGWPAICIVGNAEKDEDVDRNLLAEDEAGGNGNEEEDEREPEQVDLLTSPEQYLKQDTDPPLVISFSCIF